MTTLVSDATDQHAYDRRWWTLGVLCLSLLIVFVGNASLNVAIPTLSRALGASNSELQWVIAVYSRDCPILCVSGRDGGGQLAAWIRSP